MTALPFDVARCLWPRPVMRVLRCSHIVVMMILLCVGVVAAVLVQRAVHAFAEQAVESAFTSDFTSFVQLYASFFSDRSRALQSCADAVAALGAFPSPQEYALVGAPSWIRDQGVTANVRPTYDRLEL